MFIHIIYERLASNELPTKCQLKTTQNPNDIESFCHSVWSRCSKDNFHSLKRVEFAFFQLRLNSTAVKLAWLKTKGSLGLQEGGQARLQKRLYQSTHEQTQGAKKRKKIAAAAKKKARQEKEAEEGGPAYQPGMF